MQDARLTTSHSELQTCPGEMAKFKLLIVLLAVATAAADQQLIAPRLIGGVPIDTLRRFPHHVTIQRIVPPNWDVPPPCGGSILNDRWILTSAVCVDHSVRLELQFERLYIGNTVGSYSAVVDSNAVFIYPTYYDDIALVKLPFRLQFSDLIKPVEITSKPLSQLENKLAVLPGFNLDAYLNEASGTSADEQLTYAMLNVISNTQCKRYQTLWQFDEYLQMCTLGYSNNPNAPCITDYGSGLLSGWPARTELVGIYSSFSPDCHNDLPHVYTYVAKYASWIKSLINS